MRGSERAMRQHARGVARVVAIGAVLAATGVAAGAGATTGQRTAGESLSYSCAMPSGPRQVSVVATATFPTAGTAGQPIQPTGTAVTVTLPQAAVAVLAALHAAAVTATASLATKVTQGGRTTGAAWPGLAAPATPIPAKGSLALTASGAVPPVTVTAPGNATFAAAGLSLVLTPRRADGTATSPAAMRVRCALDPGQDAALATVAVAGTTGIPAPGRRRTIRNGDLRTAGSGTRFCPPLLKALKLNPRFPPPPPPPGSVIDHSSGLPPYCAYATGFSDVQKLNGAALLGPALTNISPFLNSIFNAKDNYFQQDSAGELSYHGLREFPPAKAMFLTFGFVPASALMQLTETGTVNIVTVGPLEACNKSACKPTITTVSSRVRLRIHDVTVNGAPLNVGPHCQTAPFNVILTGSSASNPPYSFTTGGPLTATITIPLFTGCGVGENLNTLFNASISGPGNFTLLTQGPVCEQSGTGFQCPPKKPKPLRQVTG